MKTFFREQIMFVNDNLFLPSFICLKNINYSVCFRIYSFVSCIRHEYNSKDPSGCRPMNMINIPGMNSAYLLICVSLWKGLSVQIAYKPNFNQAYNYIGYNLFKVF